MSKAAPGAMSVVVDILVKHGLIRADEIQDIGRVELVVDSKEGVSLTVRKFVHTEPLYAVLTEVTKRGEPDGG